MAKENSLVAEIKELSAKIALGEASCSEIRSKLSAAEGQQNETHVIESNISRMLESKGNLLAEIALGKDRQSDVDDLNQEIAAAQGQLEHHNETVIGLRRYLQKAESDLDRLIHKKRVVLELFIRSEAEQVQAEAMVHAKGFLSTFKQLQALVQIHNQIRGHANPIGNGGEHKYLSIPLFRLKSAEQHPSAAGTNWPEWQQARMVQSAYGVTAADIEKEKARLSKIGLSI